MDPTLIISFISGLLFAFLGNWMARRRGSNTTLWTLLGFFFPPTLLILKLWRWQAKPRAARKDEEDAGELNGG